MKWFFILSFVVVFAAPARAQTCLEMEAEDAAQRAGELTTLLQIANFRADVTYMSEVAQELQQFLGSCGDEATGRIAQVCGFDCHMQLGRQHLFLAADLPFLTSASGVSRNGSILSPQAAQDIGQSGLEIVDRGLRFLARQQGGGADEAAEEASYRTFVRQLVGLNALKIQLLMAAGDTWYQTVSEARVKSLDFMIAETLGSAGGAGPDSQPNLSKANTNYEAALWTLVETKMDVPAESTYDDLRADLMLLEADLTARTESVRKGYLFLNIDPLQFTTIPFEELQASLAESERELAGVEARIEAIAERWFANKEGEDTRALDEERTIRSQEVNLVAHRIGKLEQQARVFANGVQQDLNALDAEVDTFGYRQQLRTLELQLASKLAEFQNQRRQINDRQELDLIVLSKEAEIERRNELRWLLNFEMTRMNLDLQISSLQSQITEYGRQTLRNDNQLEQLARQRQIIQVQIDNAEASIDGANARIAEIETRKTQLFRQRRAVAREEICGIEAQLAFIGEAADAPFSPLLPGELPCQTPSPAFTRAQYVAGLCGEGGGPGLREKILGSQIQARAFLLKCVVGDAEFADLEPMVAGSTMIETDLDLPAELATVDCGSFTQTETGFARQLYEAEKAMLARRVTELEEQRDEINEQITFVEDWVGTFTNTIVGIQTGLAVVQGTYAALAAVPETTVAAAGLASGVYTTIKVDKPAYAAMEGLRIVLDTALKIGSINVQTELQIKALGRQLTQVRQANEQIDFQKALKSVALHNSHFQLAGRRAQGLADIRDLTLQSSIAALDCDSQELGLDEQVARLKADHRRQIAGLDLGASENDLLAFEADAQQRAIDRYTNEIAILNLDRDKLDLQVAQLTEDSARIGELVDATRTRIDRVLQAQSTVLDLAQQSDASTHVINELRDRQRAQMLALSDAELAFVETRITTETGATEELVAGLDTVIGKKLKSRELNGQILAFQGEIAAQVTAEQERLTDLVSQIDDPDQRKRLFIANQETVSELMKGIPEYITSKRRTLETANRMLHLMRRRFEVVNAITGQETGAEEVYLRNATQLAAVLHDIVDNRFFDERQINIGVAQIVIPSNSGFARKLALTETVEFEITPFAATETLMRANGHFALWAPAKFRDRRNLTLIDAFFGTQYQCTGAQWNRFALEHRGTGFVFRPIAQGSEDVAASIVVGPERLKLQTFFNLADSQDVVTRIINYWTLDTFLARAFPRQPGPVNDTTSVLPYLGAPVIGTYRLSLQPSDCPFDNAVFTLYIIFASAP